MRTVQHFQNTAVCAGPDTHVVDLADLMDARGVGCVVIVDDEQRPIGIVSDRDLTLRVVAAGRDAGKTTAGDVMSTDLLVVSPADSVIEVLRQLETRGVRRAPIVHASRIVGLISLDDLVLELGVQVWNLSEAVRAELRETQRETAGRRRRETRNDALEEIGQHLVELGDQVRDRIDRVGRDLAERLGRLRP